ncbi:MAG: ABC transporter permease [Fibrobacteres bacterium]|nr:ABC transporter permease [Fibrobacterota bacterium]
MTFFRFLKREISYRKKGLLANAAVVAIGVAAVTFLMTTSEASKRSIQLITKNMGQNLILIHEETKAEDYYMATGKEQLFPIKWIDTLLNMENVVTTYHVAILQLRDTINGVNAVLTGAKPVKGLKTASPSEKKNPFTEIIPGSVRLGSEVATELNVKAGSSILIKGKTFIVDRIEKSLGTTDDYRIYLDLKEMQSLAGVPQNINAVLALDCLCEGEPISVTEKRIRDTIVRILPNIKVMSLRKIAIARHEAREATDKYNRIVIILLMAASIAFIVIHSWSEARHREKESALLSALGYPSSLTVKMYLSKSLIISIIPTLAGFAIGSITALKIGEQIVKAKIQTDYTLLPWLLGAALVICIIAFLPALNRALKSDPVDLLREE